MKILEVEQGSNEWMKIRAAHFTASEAPAMMGASKYQTRTELLNLKHTGITPEVSGIQQRIFDQGHAAEAAARPFAEQFVGEELYPATAESDDHPQLLASFDGITMLEGVIWEHKLFNQALADQVKAYELEPHYYWQLEQQLLVSGAERCLFMCSDGTQENMAYMWYEAQPGRSEQLLAGWKQFEADLAVHVPTEVKAAPTAAPVLDLPAVSVHVSGELAIKDNFSVFETALRDFVENRLITKPQTDQDFADLEGQIKTLKKAESALDAAEAQLLSQVSTVDALKRTKDLLHKLARDNRLTAEKLVKSEKEARRLEILQTAKRALTDHLAKLSARLDVVSMPQMQADFAGAMKGKRTISSLQSAADDTLASAKIEANAWADNATDNLRTLEELASSHRFLFNDLQVIIAQPHDHFELIVKSRIADHEEVEKKRLDAERDRIRQEEAAKLQAEAAKLEAQQKAEAEEILQAQASAERIAEGKREWEAIEPVEPAPHFTMPTGRRTVGFDVGFQEVEQLTQNSTPPAEEMVSISRREYDELRAASDMLDALRAAGVDNWSGYADAMSEVA